MKTPSAALTMEQEPFWERSVSKPQLDFSVEKQASFPPQTIVPYGTIVTNKAISIPTLNSVGAYQNGMLSRPDVCLPVN